VVICLEQGADLLMAQLMPLPLTVSCFSKIQIGFAYLVPAHPGSPGQRAVKRVCVCVFLVKNATVPVQQSLFLCPDLCRRPAVRSVLWRAPFLRRMSRAVCNCEVRTEIYRQCSIQVFVPIPGSP